MSKKLKSKKATLTFGVLAFLFGILFTTKQITGNVIISNYQQFNAISLIGILLIACAVILFAYSAKKK